MHGVSLGACHTAERGKLSTWVGRAVGREESRPSRPGTMDFPTSNEAYVGGPVHLPADS